MNFAICDTSNAIFYIFNRENIDASGLNILKKMGIGTTTFKSIIENIIYLLK